MSKQPDAVRRMLPIGRPLQCDDDDYFIECVSDSMPAMTKGSSVVSSDSGCIASDRFIAADSRGLAAFQREETQSTIRIRNK